MELKPGDKLGPYEILSTVGKGGMGEVWRARDPQLGRDVAIKVSAQQFTDRFEREARAIAALNHPNVCTLYHIGPNYLVMEYIEGPTLAERIAEGPIPLGEALAIARQIAAALEAAHDKNIVHRDLKPANVKIRPDGSVKVLDFGLAKSVEPSELSADSPTMMSMSAMGMIMGTAGYMSPEQARGKTDVDKRADIWAFGVVLYEMLTGKRLFQGEDIGDTLASVLKEQPSLDDAPQQVRPLLKRCLEKDPRKRLRDIGDMDLLLAAEGPAPPAPVPAATSRGRLPWIAAAGVLAIALAVVSWIAYRETPPAAQTLRSAIVLPDGSTVHSLAISPDGRTLVIAAAVNGKRQLWLRPMDALQAQPMPFTEDGKYPFWSPDSRTIGFFAQGKLKKVAASGGPAQSLCDALNARGGSWNRDDVIVFSGSASGIAIQRVAAAGGVPVDVTGTRGYLKNPVFLPDGRHFLYLAANGTSEQNGIYVSSLDGKENRRVLPDVSSAVFAPPAPSDTGKTGRIGDILFVRENTLMAAPFDAASAQVAGDVFPVAEGISATTDITYVKATVSENGMLLYQSGGAAGGTNQFGWYDRSGKSLGPVGAPGPVRGPAISPDEKSVVFQRTSGTGTDLWVRDLTRGTDTRFTSNASVNISPVWSPQGDRIVFASNRKDGVYNLSLLSKLAE